MTQTSLVILEGAHFPEQIMLLQDVFDAADEVTPSAIWSSSYSKIDETFHLHTDAASIPISMIATKQGQSSYTVNLFRFEHPMKTIDLMFPQWNNSVDITSQTSINDCFLRLSNRFKMAQIEHLEMLRPGPGITDLPAGILASLEGHPATRELLDIAIEMQKNMPALPGGGIASSSPNGIYQTKWADLILEDSDQGQAFRLTPNPMTAAPGLRWVKGKHIPQSELPAELQNLPSFWSGRILSFGEDLLISMSSTWRFPINPDRDPIHTMAILPGFHRFAEKAKRICSHNGS